MREIMISIQPQWVEKILNKEKTIEIRKTKPNCELPCRVYIYCTKSKTKYLRKLEAYNKTIFITEDKDILGRTEKVKSILGEYTTFIGSGGFNGKVVAEFTLNKVSTYDWDTDFLNTKQNMYYIKSGEADKTCLTYEQLCDYGKGKNLYGWYIDNLKIYDKPKELSKFRTAGYCFNSKNIKIKQSLYGDYVGNYNENSFCRICKYYDSDWGDCTKTINTLTRPPQSWCYVEGVSNE